MLILVVEDELLTAMALADALARAGHEVLGPAETASAALQLAERSPPDFAFVDIMLADGSKGTELARELQAQWKTPVVFASASPTMASANRDVALGYLSKPFTEEDVLGTLEVAMRVMEGGTPPPPPIPYALEVYSR